MIIEKWRAARALKRQQKQRTAAIDAENDRLRREENDKARKAMLERRKTCKHAYLSGGIITEKIYGTQFVNRSIVLYCPRCGDTIKPSV